MLLGRRRGRTCSSYRLITKPVGRYECQVGENTSANVWKGLFPILAVVT